MARKLTDEECDTKTARIKELELENSDLEADVELLKLERDGEKKKANLETELEALGRGD